MGVTEIDTERGRDKGSETDTEMASGARHERGEGRTKRDAGHDERSDEARVTDEEMKIQVHPPRGTEHMMKRQMSLWTFDCRQNASKIFTRVKNLYTCQKLDFDQVSHLTPILPLFLEIFSHFHLFRLSRDACLDACLAPLASAHFPPFLRLLSSLSLPILSYLVFSNAACQASFLIDACIDFGLKPNIFTQAQYLYSCQKFLHVSKKHTRVKFPTFSHFGPLCAHARSASRSFLRRPVRPRARKKPGNIPGTVRQRPIRRPMH